MITPAVQHARQTERTADTGTVTASTLRRTASTD